jgi:hypothetical protein
MSTTFDFACMGEGGAVFGPSIYLPPKGLRTFLGFGKKATQECGFTEL